MGQDENEERGNWSSRIDFLLSIIGYAVGLGNVWRFPYLAYRNGGASFLFPYIIMLVIAGIPLFFIELAIGQFASEGPITVWQMAPLFQGIGYAMVIVSAVVGVYYNMIIAYALYYLFVSFVNLDDGLPWADCGQSWNTDSCRTEPFPDLTSNTFNFTTKMSILWGELYNQSCVQERLNITAYSDYNSTSGTSAIYSTFSDGLISQFPGFSGVFDNITNTEVQGYDGFSSCKIKYTTASEEYWERYVLRQQHSPGLEDLGDISPKLLATLFICWLFIFACLMKGIKTSGKVVYFTATFPYAVLVVLLVRGLTLEGYDEGIRFYVIPEWDKLTDVKIWGDAATQIFYSLGIGFGGLLTMASYNDFHNNCYRDAIMVACINCGTSIFAGFVIFSLLGHMAFLTNQEVADVATSGPGLTFVAYPDGVSRLPASPLWAFLFFFMVLTLGLDSQFATMEAVISGISDLYPKVLRKYKRSFTLICCLIGFLAGIPLCTQGGIRVLTLMNDYSGSYNLLVIALVELICLCLVYGINNFLSDIEMMVGFKPTYYWIITWCGVTPAATMFIIVVSAVQYETSSYDDQVFPDWAEGIGWVMVTVPIIAIFIVAAVQFYRLGYPDCIRPTATWGPALDKHRTGRYAALNRAFVDDNGETPYVLQTNGGTEVTKDNEAPFDEKTKL